METRYYTAMQRVASALVCAAALTLITPVNASIGTVDFKTSVDYGAPFEQLNKQTLVQYIRVDRTHSIQSAALACPGNTRISVSITELPDGGGASRELVRETVIYNPRPTAPFIPHCLAQFDQPVTLRSGAKYAIESHRTDAAFEPAADVVTLRRKRFDKPNWYMETSLRGAPPERSSSQLVFALFEVGEPAPRVDKTSANTDAQAAFGAYLQQQAASAPGIGSINFAAGTPPTTPRVLQLRAGESVAQSFKFAGLGGFDKIRFVCTSGSFRADLVHGADPAGGMRFHSNLSVAKLAQPANTCQVSLPSSISGPKYAGDAFTFTLTAGQSGGGLPISQGPSYTASDIYQSGRLYRGGVANNSHNDGRDLLFQVLGNFRVGGDGGKTANGAPVRSALTVENGKTFLFFDNNTYARYTSTGIERGYPKPMPGGWQLPQALQAGGGSAALRWTAPENGRYIAGRSFMFQGKNYTRLQGTVVDAGYPRELPGGWRVPAPFHAHIDAAAGDASLMQHFMFQGDKIIRLEHVNPLAGYPKTIAQEFPALPAKFRKGHFDAATVRGVSLYLFKGSQYQKLHARTGELQGPVRSRSEFPK